MDLEFIGLVIFQNKLKSETTPVIDELRKARIVTVMATGIVFKLSLFDLFELFLRTLRR